MERRENEMIAQRMKAPAANAAPAAGAPVRISSKAEFDKLPKGTSFIAPDGTTRIKP